MNQRLLPHIKLTDHALRRTGRRGVSVEAIKTVLHYGRVEYSRGARYHVIGKKEVRRWMNHGKDLRSVSGMHVVCAPEQEGHVVLTVFFNQDLKPLSRGRRQKRGQRARSQRASTPRQALWG